MGLGIGVYVKNSVEAVELYQQVFGLELGYHVKNSDGSFYHSELMKNDEPFISAVEATKEKRGEQLVQLGYEFENAEEVKRAFAMLEVDGTVDLPVGELPWTPCAASVIDRFGIWWYLSCNSHQPPEDYDYWKEDKFL